MLVYDIKEEKLTLTPGVKISLKIKKDDINECCMDGSQ